LITGSSGFIGSRTVLNLCGINKICGIDIRDPSEILKKNVSFDTTLLNIDMNNHDELNETMDNYIDKNGAFDYIIHYATFWNYEPGNVDKYTDTIKYTMQLYNLAKKYHTKGFIFASSVEVLPSILNERKSDTFDRKIHIHPYGWSKIMIEKYLMNNANNEYPKVSVLRIGGVFSDWCELPPLSWLINRWSQKNILGRLIPGKGNTGIPFVHRDDLIKFIEEIINKHDRLNNYNIFMVSNPHSKYEMSTTHNKLFPLIRNNLGLEGDPIYVNLHIVKLGLMIEHMIGRHPPEQLWMMYHIDCDNLDKDNIREILEWMPQYPIEECLPRMLRLFHERSAAWDKFQNQRENHNYSYHE